MSCDTLQQVVDRGDASLAAIQQATATPDAKNRGTAAIKALTAASAEALAQAKATPDGALAAVSGETRAALKQAVIDLHELAQAESVAALDGHQAAFGDGTFLRLLLEYLPMLLELFKTFFGAQPEGTQPA